MKTTIPNYLLHRFQASNSGFSISAKIPFPIAMAFINISLSPYKTLESPF
jgi:hypothetical protein